MVARSPVWNHPLRNAAAVASGWRWYPVIITPGRRGRTTSSPTVPGATSQSSASTTATSYWGTGRPEAR